MITRNFFEELGLLSVPVLERPEGCFVAQVFLRDVVIIQVDEAFERCLECRGRSNDANPTPGGHPRHQFRRSG